MSKGPFIFEFTENDLLPWLEADWEDEDITGFPIQLNVRKTNGLKFTGTAAVDEAAVDAVIDTR